MLRVYVGWLLSDSPVRPVDPIRPVRNPGGFSPSVRSCSRLCQDTRPAEVLPEPRGYPGLCPLVQYGVHFWLKRFRQIGSGTTSGMVIPPDAVPLVQTAAGSWTGGSPMMHRINPSFQGMARTGYPVSSVKCTGRPGMLRRPAPHPVLIQALNRPGPGDGTCGRPQSS